MNGDRSRIANPLAWTVGALFFWSPDLAVVLAGIGYCGLLVVGPFIFEARGHHHPPPLGAERARTLPGAPAPPA